MNNLPGKYWCDSFGLIFFLTCIYLPWKIRPVTFFWGMMKSLFHRLEGWNPTIGKGHSEAPGVTTSKFQYQNRISWESYPKNGEPKTPNSYDLGAMTPTQTSCTIFAREIPSKGTSHILASNFDTPQNNCAPVNDHIFSHQLRSPQKKVIPQLPLVLGLSWPLYESPPDPSRA